MNEKSTLRKNANDYLTHTKCTKGITLIALVVTIVVLIILATVSINEVFSENGIVRKAQEAKDTSRGGEVRDYVFIAVTENQMATYPTATKKSKNDVIQELYEQGKLTDEEVAELEEVDIIQIGNITIDFSSLPSGEVALVDFSVYGVDLTCEHGTTWDEFATSVYGGRNEMFDAIVRHSR